MEKNNETFEKAIMALMVIVSAILTYTTYQHAKLAGFSYLTVISLVFILALIGLVIWLLVDKAEFKTAVPHEKIKAKPTPLTQIEKITYGFVVFVALLIVFNQMQLSQASALLGVKSPLTFKTSSSKVKLQLTGDPVKDAIAVMIPTGTPFYGEALRVSFDDPIKSLDIIANLDPSYGRNKLQLTSAEKEKYIRILTTPSMGCEYCCGADTAVTKDGRPTCGCQHSWAMRGLGAYLIKNYPDMTDEQIMREISKWKALFFPKQMVQKYIQETQSGQFTADISSILLDVDEDKLKEMKTTVASSDSQASGNDASASLEDLPGMVGGC
ncbi:MAG TPA: hypothetical protein VJI97_00885 [Candidatus Nanoarchaeia archaeon]|nr:hypothetical protein [Candidatus Nanoarchaeia archaeon]